MPAELPSAQQFTEEVEVVMSLDQQVSIQGQELADAANEVRLTAAKIHFMDMFEWVKVLDPLTIFDWCMTSSYL